MKQFFTPTTLTLAASVLFLAGQASADPWNKKTYVTFPNTVELPGRVTLPPGNYTMKLMDSQSNRFIVQVSNHEENKVFATFHTIPQYRDRPAEKTTFTFYETPGSAPRFIHTWYYPGDTTGREFIYTKDRKAYIASLNGRKSSDVLLATTASPTQERTATAQEEVGVTTETDTDRQSNVAVTDYETDRDTETESPDAAYSSRPVTTDTDTDEETAVTDTANNDAVTFEEDGMDNAADDAGATADDDQAGQQPAETSRSLPKTASELPLAALMGIALIGLGTIARRS